MTAAEYYYRDRRTRQHCIDVMSVLREEGPCTRKELQLLCHLSKNQVVKAVRKLESDDRIIKEPYQEDKRKNVYRVAQDQ